MQSRFHHAVRTIRHQVGRLTRRNRTLRRLLECVNNARLVLRDNILPVKVDPNLVVFASFSGRSIAGSPLAIYERLTTDPKYDSLRFVWAVRNSGGKAAIPPALTDSRTTVVEYGSKQFCRALRAAGVWVSSTALPEHIRRRPEQRYVQTWHGTPLKRLGADIAPSATKSSAHNFATRYRRDAKRMTHLISSSPFTSATFSSAFSLDELDRTDVLTEVGNPRNDRLVAASRLESNERTALRNAMRTKIGLPLDATVVLYAPTWRDDQAPSAHGYDYDVSLDVGALRRAWGNDVVIAFRAHYLMAARLLDADATTVIDVSHIDDVNDVILSADALITDYSSILFDFALVDRPMYFYVPDLDHYAGAARGLYFDITELPGPVVRTNAELAAQLGPGSRGDTDPDTSGQTSPSFDPPHTPPVGSGDSTGSDDSTPGRSVMRHAAFLARFATWDDGDASERLVARVWHD